MITDEPHFIYYFLVDNGSMSLKKGLNWPEIAGSNGWSETPGVIGLRLAILDLLTRDWISKTCEYRLTMFLNSTSEKYQEQRNTFFRKGL